MDSKNANAVNQCYHLLALCARAEAHSAMDAELARQVAVFTAWAELPAQAELHGMGPLLRHHLKRVGISIPDETKRFLDGLYLRHRRWNQVNTEVLLELTSMFEKAGLRVLVLKGLALAYEYYPDPALRPASDIDLLLKTEDVLPALNLLKEAGFDVNTPLTTRDLLPKELTVDSPLKNGPRTHIELHHYDPRIRSVYDNSPDDEFAGFDAPPHPVKVGESVIYAPDPMDTLNYLVKHLTRHMFVATDARPLLLKWVADIVCLVEHHAETIDWANIEKRIPCLLNRLTVIYSLTPLPERLANIISVKQISPPTGVNQYPQGWPQHAFPEWKRVGLWEYIKRTLAVPSPWWLRLQYGIDDKSVFWYGHVIYRLQVIKIAFSKLL